MMMWPAKVFLQPGAWIVSRILVCVAVLAGASAWASSIVPLAWNPSPDLTVVGYKIYYGTVSQNYTSSVDVGNVTNASITLPLDGTTYYFAATTYDASGMESGFSNEANYTTPAVVSPQPPTLAALNNVSINENAGLQSVTLAGLGLGTGATLAITASSSNPALIPNPSVNYTSPSATGTLTFAPVQNMFGTAIITVTANNGLAQSNLVSRSFTVTVAAVNQPPTLNAISNLNLTVGAAAQKVVLSGISSGAANENQVLSLTAVSSNTKLVPNPTVSYTSPSTTGTLALKPVAKATGTAVITVTVNDGGTSNNIVTRIFTVTVAAQSSSSSSTTTAAVARPKLTEKLSDSVVLAGKTVTLKMGASGKGPFQYQWMCNGTNVPGATKATLTLKNITAKQAGLYYVTVSNSGGYTNSAPAALYVFSTPTAVLTDSARVNGRFSFNILGVTGYKYTVQSSPDLVHWTDAKTAAAPFAFTDGTSNPSGQCYYRTVYKP